MTNTSIEEAREAARQFLVLIREMQYEEEARGAKSPKHRGALRRKSMELTRLLAKMRKPG